MDLTSLSIYSPLFINDNPRQYYKMLWLKCKKVLTNNKFIDLLGWG